MECAVIHLVTGGAGFIGSNIVRRLVDDGCRVRVLDNFATGRRENLADLGGEIELVEGDIRDTDAVRRAVKDCRYVFHLGALPSVAGSVEDPATYDHVNTTGTLNMLIAARDAGVDRFVFSSSSAIFGNAPGLPKREDMLPDPLSPYAVQKLAGECYCRIFHELYGLKTFALRYFNVFGPRQDPKSQYSAVIPLFIDALCRGQAPHIHGDGGQTRDFVFVGDVVAANLSCREAPADSAGGVYNVARGEKASIREIADQLIGIMGSDLQPVHDEPRPGDVRHSVGDATRARELLGWIPQTSFEDGLEQTVRYFTG